MSGDDDAPGGGRPPRPAKGLSLQSRIGLAVLTVALAAAVVMLLRGGADERAIVAVTVPELSAAAERGRAVFTEVCAACHGAQAQGSDTGPTLVHPIYRPGLHSDFAFVRAVAQGVRAHHWGFGAMPPQPAVPPEAVPDIVAYVRELQRANGID